MLEFAVFQQQEGAEKSELPEVLNGLELSYEIAQEDIEIMHQYFSDLRKNKENVSTAQSILQLSTLDSVAALWLDGVRGHYYLIPACLVVTSLRMAYGLRNERNRRKRILARCGTT